MKNKSKILVTGAAGFIGFHFAEYELKKGNIVIGVDNLNNYYDKKVKISRLNILKKYKNFIFFKMSLLDENFYKSLKKYFNVEFANAKNESFSWQSNGNYIFSKSGHEGNYGYLDFKHKFPLFLKSEKFNDNGSFIQRE